MLPRSLLSLAVVAGIFGWSLGRAAAGQSTGRVAVLIAGLTALQSRVFGLVEGTGLISSHRLYFQKYTDAVRLETTVLERVALDALAKLSPKLDFPDPYLAARARLVGG